MIAWVTEGRRAILLDRLGHDDIAAVCCDDAHGARALVDHLHATGRRRIGYVADLPGRGHGPRQRTTRPRGDGAAPLTPSAMVFRMAGSGDKRPPREE